MSTSNHNISSPEGLNAREKTVINFVSNNPGVTKQQVVNALDGVYSRVIIFDTIKDLERYGMIVVQKNKPNTRIHNLYINKSSPILIEINRLSQFEISMMNMLQEIKKKDIRLRSTAADDFRKLKIDKRIKKVSEIHGITFHKKEEIKNAFGSQSLKQINDILNDLKHSSAFKNEVIHIDMFFRLLRIFWHVLQAYSFKALFIWPFQINNKSYSNKLIQSVLDKLIEIQIKMVQILNDVSSAQSKNAELMGYGFKPADIYKQSIEHLKKEVSFLPSEEELVVFRKHDLDREIKNVLNSVYPITKDLFA